MRGSGFPLILAALLLAPAVALFGGSVPCTPSHPCPAWQFCRAPDGTCDPSTIGSCEDLPTDCPTDVARVCACDGMTYENECLALAEGLSISEQHACFADLCGGAYCPTGFCKLSGRGCAGSRQFEGTCTPIPASCPPVDDPVCGCDNVT